ncbi:hypothetical protein Tco_0153588 [Tanacetum coccineum]
MGCDRIHMSILSLRPCMCASAALLEIDDDLFTYEVEVANILCDSNMDDDLEHKADDDIGYDPSDVAFTELLEETMKFTGEESSDNKDDVAEVFRIDTNIFDYETPLCLAFNEFNYLLKVDLDILTKDIMSHGLIMEYGRNQHQSNTIANLSIIRLDVRNGQPVVEEWMVIVMKEICSVLTLLETRSITKTLNVIMEYLVNISKRRAFWSLNKDILKINDSDYQYAVYPSGR